VHRVSGTTLWRTTFCPFGVLLAPAETCNAHTYALLALQEASRRVLGIDFTVRAQSTDAASASLKLAQNFAMDFSTLCFPHIVRHVTQCCLLKEHVIVMKPEGIL
jgi:hypothetical protein